MPDPKPDAPPEPDYPPEEVERRREELVRKALRTPLPDDLKGRRKKPDQK